MPGLERYTAALSETSIEADGENLSRFEPRVWAPCLGEHTPATVSLAFPSHLASALLAGTLSIPNDAIPEPQDDTWHDGTPVEDRPASSMTNEDVGDTGLAESQAAELAGILAAKSREIDSAIQRLGGVAVPKLGCVAPSDATWVSFTRSLRCERATDVLTLLGASERVMRIADGHPPPSLALRSCIHAMDSIMEYRVFVRTGLVVGLSQRNLQAPSALGQAGMDRVVAAVTALFETVVRAALSDYEPIECGKYVLDVFVDRTWRVWILDVAPWGDPTDALLFTWSELEAAEWIDNGDGRAQMRCVGTSSVVRPAQTMYDALPVELRDANSSDALAAAAQRLAELEIGRNPNDSHSSDDDSASEVQQ